MLGTTKTARRGKMRKEPKFGCGSRRLISIGLAAPLLPEDPQR
jgi:hypothetical protein